MDCVTYIVCSSVGLDVGGELIPRWTRHVMRLMRALLVAADAVPVAIEIEGIAALHSHAAGVEGAVPGAVGAVVVNGIWPQAAAIRGVAASSGSLWGGTPRSVRLQHVGVAEAIA